ncbi:MAG TPA: hypothetical protein VEP28_12370, partial [Rubrobacter sp.]|nr:hypothetical protein [Rubrobacter sp.]
VGTDRDAPGSPALLGVTEEFLSATGASSRDDFPPVDSLVTQEELSRVRERLASSGPGEPGCACRRSWPAPARHPPAARPRRPY